MRPVRRTWWPVAVVASVVAAFGAAAFGAARLAARPAPAGDAATSSTASQPPPCAPPPLRATDAPRPRTAAPSAAPAPTPPEGRRLAWLVRDEDGRPVIDARIESYAAGRLSVDEPDDRATPGLRTATWVPFEPSSLPDDERPSSPSPAVVIVHPSFRVQLRPIPPPSADGGAPEIVVLERGETLEGALVASSEVPPGTELVARPLLPAPPPRGFHELGTTPDGVRRVRVRVRPDDRGRFVVRGLERGTWIVAPAGGCVDPPTLHPDLWDAMRRVVRLPGGPIELDLRSRRIAVLVTSGGAPVPDASVTFPGRHGTVTLVTDTLGRTSGHVRLPVGASTVRVRARGFAPVERALAPGSEDAELAIELVPAVGAPDDEPPARRMAEVQSLRVLGGRGLPRRVPLRLFGPDGRRVPIRVGWFLGSESVEFEDPVPTATYLDVCVEADLVDGTYVFEAGDDATGTGRQTWDAVPFRDVPPIVLPSDPPGGDGAPR